MLMIRRKPGLSPEAFRSGYEARHVPTALRLFGHLWTAYRRNYAVTAERFSAEVGTPTEARAGRIDAPFDVVTEMEFADPGTLEEMNRIATEPENMRLLAAQEEALFDREHCWTSMCEVVEADLGEGASG